MLAVVNLGPPCDLEKKKDNTPVAVPERGVENPNTESPDTVCSHYPRPNLRPRKTTFGMERTVPPPSLVTLITMSHKSKYPKPQCSAGRVVAFAVTAPCLTRRMRKAPSSRGFLLFTTPLQAPFKYVRYQFQTALNGEGAVQLDTDKSIECLNKCILHDV